MEACSSSSHDLDSALDSTFHPPEDLPHFFCVSFAGSGFISRLSVCSLRIRPLLLLLLLQVKSELLPFQSVLFRCPVSSHRGLIPPRGQYCLLSFPSLINISRLSSFSSPSPHCPAPPTMADPNAAASLPQPPSASAAGFENGSGSHMPPPPLAVNTSMPAFSGIGSPTSAGVSRAAPEPVRRACHAIAHKLW